MINQKINEDFFLSVLAEAKKRLLLRDLSKIKSGDDFEAVFYEVIKPICLEKGLKEGDKEDFYRTGKQTFPDIIIGSFGIEVKFTSGDTWISTGNSITETTRVDDLKKIYMFFCKQGKEKKADAIYKPYEECLSEIVVTHNPRYRINMELKSGESIFDKIGIDYESFCNADPIKEAKEYYRKHLKSGEELWWIDNESIPIIKNFGDLDDAVQLEFKCMVMILYSEIFSGSHRKYLKPAIHLLQHYQAICSSFRDLFSAAGRVEITLTSGKIVKAPRVLSHLYNNSKLISKMLPGLKINEKEWLSAIDKQNEFKEVNASEIYTSGLRA